MLADLSLNKLSKYFYLKYLGDRDMVLKILIFWGGGGTLLTICF